jgi:hypothetical protein
MTVSATIALEANFAGTAWTDIYSDVRISNGIQLSRGKTGNTPCDRIASTGVMSFAMDNSTHNSGGTLGWYSPDHANVRSGWGLGMKARLKITYDGTPYYKFRGKIDNIAPAMGAYRERDVSVSVVDYMDELASHKLGLIPAKSNVRGQELLAAVVTNMPNAPLATDYDTGDNIYAHGLHSEKDELTTGMNACQKIAQTGMDDICVTGDLTGGETLVYRSRHERMKIASSAASFDDSMTGLRVHRSRDNLFNQFKVTVHPSQEDTSPVILYSIQREISLAPGQAYTFTARYTDPLSSGARVSASGMIAPVIDVDYWMAYVSEETVTTSSHATKKKVAPAYVMSASLGVQTFDETGVAGTFGANSCQVTLTNNGTKQGFVTRFNLRGYGLYEYDPVDITGEDGTSTTLNGDHPLNYDMPYQHNRHVGEDFKNYFVSRYSTPRTVVDSMEFIANASDAIMKTALSLDVGSRITLRETMTGINTDYFVGHYSLIIEPTGVIRCVLGALEPVDDTVWFIIGSSDIGSTDDHIAY